MKFFTLHPEAVETARLLQEDPEGWKRDGSGYVMEHLSGLDIWVTGAGFLAVHPDGWQTDRRAPWDARIIASRNQRHVWKAYQKWRHWDRAQPPSPTTLGWRSWFWDGTVLRSPYWDTPWPDGELRCDTWSEKGVIRGESGIHALLLPRAWARRKPDGMLEGPPSRYGKALVTGVVERFGRYVLGTEGWRAEWAVIRKLAAPSEQIGLALERAYPDVEVIYAHR